VIDFTDNGLDPRSGTIRGRAVFANPNSFLTPGLFGDMRLAAGTATQAMLVPDTAIQSDQARKTVLVVGDDNTVIAKPITLGPVVDGLRVVRAGLTPQDRVVIQGMQGAIPGAKAAPHDGQIVPEATATAAASVIPASSQATFAR
jgi:multidrug efflux pump subunit AcrA (membrane-fusion protein)